MIDRAIRPLFPKDYKDEVSIIVTVMSYDEENDPLILALNAVSVALMNSTSPFEGPIGGVRIGLEDGRIVNLLKTMDETTPEESMDYVVAGDGKKFSMIDGACHDIEEDLIIKGMEKSLEYMQSWIDEQNKFLTQLEPKRQDL
jgi:polyribonucleotide nucleotidyltransferase